MDNNNFITTQHYCDYDYDSDIEEYDQSDDDSYDYNDFDLSKFKPDNNNANLNSIEYSSDNEDDYEIQNQTTQQQTFHSNQEYVGYHPYRIYSSVPEIYPKHESLQFPQFPNLVLASTILPTHVQFQSFFSINDNHSNININTNNFNDNDEDEGENPIFKSKLQNISSDPLHVSN